jgi:hypothetical protein
MRPCFEVKAKHDLTPIQAALLSLYKRFIACSLSTTDKRSLEDKAERSYHGHTGFPACERGCNSVINDSTIYCP